MTTLSRQVSIERVMRAIANYGPISRASLAKELGLSKQTISEVMLKLEERQWVHVIGQTQGHIGRRAVTYELNPNCAGVVVVDLGGTKIRGCVANLLGQIDIEDVIATYRNGGMEVLKQIAQLVKGLIEKSQIDSSNIKLAVVGVPGVPDEQNGSVIMAPNIAGIDQINVQATLQDLLGLKVVIENDVNLAAKGEHWLNENLDGCVTDTIIFIAIGTGLGAGVIVNGLLLKGFSNMAGEIGYMPLEDGTILEDKVSGVALEAAFKNRTGQAKTAREIFELATTGNADAEKALQYLVKALVQAMKSLNFIINPNKFILGGSIGIHPYLLTSVKAEWDNCEWVLPPVESASAGQYAALAGGVAIGLEQTQFDLFAAPLSEGLLPDHFVSFRNINPMQFSRMNGGKS